MTPLCLTHVVLPFGVQPYRGLKIPKVQQWHKNVHVVYGTILWLWMFWRIKHDGAAFMVRARMCAPQQQSLTRPTMC